MSGVLVPPARLERWYANFVARHGAGTLRVQDGGLVGAAEDGSSFVASLPFSRTFHGSATVPDFVAAAAPPADWGVLLVRKGGFAVARLNGADTVASKVGQRHVQGRTKAGGQSQLRFARRRDNQARVAFEAAASHASALLSGVPVLVVGGDRAAVAAALAEAGLQAVVAGEFLTVPDPRRGVLTEAVLDAGALRIAVTNA